MALPPEVRRTIKALDKKIKDLEDTKRRLIETFGGVPARPSASELMEVISRPVPVVKGASLVAAADTASSIDRFVAYLAEHGPSTRAELMSAGIPGGSISWLIRRVGRRREDGLIELAS